MWYDESKFEELSRTIDARVEEARGNCAAFDNLAFKAACLNDKSEQEYWEKRHRDVSRDLTLLLGLQAMAKSIRTRRAF